MLSAPEALEAGRLGGARGFGDRLGRRARMHVHSENAEFH
jgi:hypothetical protein